MIQRADGEAAAIFTAPPTSCALRDTVSKGARRGRWSGRQACDPQGAIGRLRPEEIEVVPSSQAASRFSSIDLQDDGTQPAVSFSDETHTL